MRSTLRRVALFALLVATLSVPGVPDSSGLSAETLAQVAELQAQKTAAVENEDYDLAKRLKAKIADLSTPPVPEESDEDKHKKRIEVVRKGIADVRDKNHDGDTHKFFDHLDHDDNEHLTDVELMTILGADPKKPKEKKGGMFTKIMDSMVEGMKKSLDTNGDGKVTKDEFHQLLHGDI
jgi:hypothetical protein